MKGLMISPDKLFWTEKYIGTRKKGAGLKHKCLKQATMKHVTWTKKIKGQF